MKIRSEKHLAFVRKHRCCIKRDGQNCNGTPVHAHHLTFLGGQGMATKECDSKTAPLCPMHHDALHWYKDGEEGFWEKWGIDAEELVREFAEKSPCREIAETVLR